MNNEASWAAIAVSVIALVGTIFSNINARKANRDKLEFEFKMKELEVKSQGQDAVLERMSKELSDCREQHAASEADRQSLRVEVNKLKEQLVKLGKSSWS